jgi:hypothetical protein
MDSQVAFHFGRTHSSYRRLCNIGAPGSARAGKPARAAASPITSQSARRAPSTNKYDQIRVSDHSQRSSALQSPLTINNSLFSPPPAHRCLADPVRGYRRGLFQRRVQDAPGRMGRMDAALARVEALGFHLRDTDSRLAVFCCRRLAASNWLGHWLA